MLKRLYSKRFRRWPATVAWIIALSVSAWVAADLVVLLTAPPNVAAFFRAPTDPVAAARTIAGVSPMALAASPAARPSAAPAYTLVGYATGFGRDRGFALLKGADGAVIAATEGEALAPGVTLAKIHADRVEIERAGLTETLRLEPPKAPGSPQPVATTSSRTNH